jgi:hypothetical protein
MTTRQQAQTEWILSNFEGIIGVGRAWGYAEGPVWYMFREHHILVRDQYLDEVRRLLRGAGYLRAEGEVAGPVEGETREELPGEQVVQGVRLLRLTGQHTDTLGALEVIRDGTGSGADRLEGLGRGVATPDHLVSICNGHPGESGGCPATEPHPIAADSDLDPAPTPRRRAGEGVRVVVVDTGLDPEAERVRSWLAGVEGDPDLDIGKGSPRALAPYAGHGTFIAGIIRTLAPGAEVVVRRGFDRAGAVFESTLVQTLDKVLDENYPDIINMSAGTFTFDPTGLLSFEVFQRNRLHHHKGVVLVVAAGNQGYRKPFWPAAAPWTVSVGALDRTLRARADFSNFGGWVDVYAPGEDLVNAFPTGLYTYVEPPYRDQDRQEHFTGRARWSGTSFATPVVSALIAARMSETGENGRDAAAALLALARTQHQPGVGAVLLPT